MSYGATDRKHGLPYLNATDLLSLMALGVPARQRYLSCETETDIDALVIREGMLLLTCSGTIGRVFYVPSRLDGWAATHDLIRIVPAQPEMAGCVPRHRLRARPDTQPYPRWSN